MIHLHLVCRQNFVVWFSVLSDWIWKSYILYIALFVANERFERSPGSNRICFLHSRKTTWNAEDDSQCHNTNKLLSNGILLLSGSICMLIFVHKLREKKKEKACERGAPLASSSANSSKNWGMWITTPFPVGKRDKRWLHVMTTCVCTKI